jgi:hypothetical protein
MSTVADDIARLHIGYAHRASHAPKCA